MTDTFTSLQSELARAQADKNTAFRASCLAGRKTTPALRAAVTAAEERVQAIGKRFNALGHFIPGQRITSSGFSGAVVRHYEGSMYEIRLPGGVCCVDKRDIVLA